MRRRVLIALFACLLTAAPATAGNLYVIVGRDSPVKRISKGQLARIYLKKTLIDNRGLPWTPLNLEVAHPIRRAFSKELFKKFPEEMEGYWNIQYFEGVSPPYVVGSEEAMISFVTSTPGAIGYIAPCQMNSSVKVVLTLKVHGPTQSQCRTTPKKQPIKSQRGRYD